MQQHLWLPASQHVPRAAHRPSNRREATDGRRRLWQAAAVRRPARPARPAVPVLSAVPRHSRWRLPVPAAPAHDGRLIPPPPAAVVAAAARARPLYPRRCCRRWRALAPVLHGDTVQPWPQAGWRLLRALAATTLLDVPVPPGMAAPPLSRCRYDVRMRCSASVRAPGRPWRPLHPPACMRAGGGAALPPGAAAPPHFWTLLSPWWIYAHRLAACRPTVSAARLPPRDRPNARAPLSVSRAWCALPYSLPDCAAAAGQWSVCFPVGRLGT